MIGEGLCTDDQAQRGLDETHRRMAQYYERMDVGTEECGLEQLVKEGNEYCKYDDIADDEESPLKKAKREWKKFEKWCNGLRQPKMKPTRVFNAVDEDNNPKQPGYALGEVISKCLDMKSGQNHADYVYGDGYYDILR